MHRVWIAVLFMVGGCTATGAGAPSSPVCDNVCDGDFARRLSQLEEETATLTAPALLQRLDTAERRLLRLEKQVESLERDRPLHLYTVSVQPARSLGRHAGGLLAYDEKLDAVVDYSAPVDLFFEDELCRVAAFLSPGEIDPSRMRIGPESTWIRVKKGLVRPIQARRRLVATAQGIECAPIAPPFNMMAVEVEDTGLKAVAYPAWTLQVGR